MTITPEQTVRNIALTSPTSIRIFERFGIDYCCGGNRPLAESCKELQLSLDQVIEKLEEAQSSKDDAPVDWQNASLCNLISHIVRTHHTRVRQELPRMITLSRKVAAKHGEKRPELVRIEELCVLLSDDMLSHLSKEEEVLFPYIHKLENAETEMPSACFPSISFPISVMEREHDAAGSIMKEIRELTGSYQTPEGACPTYLGLFTALHEFETDLHQHIHLENNILFPRATELETRMKAAAV